MLNWDRRDITYFKADMNSQQFVIQLDNNEIVMVPFDERMVFTVKKFGFKTALFFDPFNSNLLTFEKNTV